MNTNQFIAKLQTRFPKLKPIDDNSAIESQVEDIEAGLKGYTERTLDRAWKLFNDFYLFQYPPRWASINKIFLEHGLRPDKMTEDVMFKSNQRKRELENYYFWKCNKCNCYFSFISEYCPKCHKMTDRTVIKGSWPKGFINCKEKCGICKYQSYPNAYGYSCKHHGTLFSKAPMSECKECICRKCCYEKRLEENSFEEYKELLKSDKYFKPEK